MPSANLCPMRRTAAAGPLLRRSALDGGFRRPGTPRLRDYQRRHPTRQLLVLLHRELTDSTTTHTKAGRDPDRPWRRARLGRSGPATRTVFNREDGLCPGSPRCRLPSHAHRTRVSPRPASSTSARCTAAAPAPAATAGRPDHPRKENHKAALPQRQCDAVRRRALRGVRRRAAAAPPRCAGRGLLLLERPDLVVALEVPLAAGRGGTDPGVVVGLGVVLHAVVGVVPHRADVLPPLDE
jgi:hypothetical protein